MKTPANTVKGIYIALNVLFDRLNLDNPVLDWKNVWALCSNGAATLMGRKTGLLSRLQGLNKCILPVLCMAQRRALLVSNTAKCSSIKRIFSVGKNVCSVTS
jgi:hypothetical protein